MPYQIALPARLPARRPGVLTRAWRGVKRLFSRRGRESTYARHVSELRTITEVPSLDVSTTPEWSFRFAEDADPAETIKASPFFYASSREIAQALASIPFIARNAAGEPLGDGHRLQITLETPCPCRDRVDWLEEIVYFLQGSGLAYLEKIRSTARGRSALHQGKGVPVELWPHAPRAFRPQVERGRRQRITGYIPRERYSDDPDVIPISEVFSIRYVRPGDVTRGLAPAEVAEREISIDSQAAAWQQISIQNRGVPDAIVKHKSFLQDKQLEELEEVIEDKWVGHLNARIPIVLGGDLDWIPLANTPVDLDMMEGRRFARRTQTAVVGTPDVIIDPQGTTFANYETGSAVFWRHRVLPLAWRIARTLTREVAAEYEPGAWIDLDLSGVDALLPFLRERIGAARDCVNLGQPPSQANEQFELGLTGWEGWDTPLLNTGLQSLAVVLSPPTSPAPPPTPAPSPADDDTEEDA